ncbi:MULTISPECIES: hypothetical protein [Cyanophyceae]|uniref:Uncharacterized protein n=1 Tax=Leptolyngbya subtilissima DQ-A4 TaxID=2933933 RepID=A0ABV0K1A2_9CYAN|nr:hypothetical protein [Nodosilinea sp. FACHB-141]MBD2111220.1 hypothetical protein [Nodosilinea sp. FACHB-141]
MKPNSLYAQLELIQEPLDRPIQTDYSIARAWAEAKRRLSLVGSALLTYLCGSADLSVTVKRDRWGNTLFVAHDPVSQQRRTFSSEQELRVWVDQRYYQ